MQKAPDKKKSTKHNLIEELDRNTKGELIEMKNDCICT